MPQILHFCRQIMHSNKFPLRKYVPFQSLLANIKIKHILNAFICSKNYHSLFSIKLSTGIMNHSTLLLTDIVTSLREMRLSSFFFKMITSNLMFEIILGAKIISKINKIISYKVILCIQ